MSELVKLMAKELVDNPERVEVSEKQKGQLTVIELKVAQEDMGKVIGKQGRIANTIRAIVKAASIKNNKRYVVDILQS